MKVGYSRVSTVEQNEARQLEKLKELGCEKIYIDKCSGKNTNRPEFNKMIDYVREGDTVYVTEWSRLSRSTMDLLTTLNRLEEKGVVVKSVKENFDTSTPQGKLILTVFAAISQFEREIILQRQAEGINIAKQNRKYKGRQPNKYEPELLNQVISGLADKSLTVTKAAEILGVTRATVYNILNRNGGQSNEWNE